MKNIFYVIQGGIWKVDSRLAITFEDNKSCNFYITISRLNDMSFVYLKDFLIIFFLNNCSK